MRSSPKHCLTWKPMLNIHSVFNSSKVIYQKYWCRGQDNWESILECICKILQQHVDPQGATCCGPLILCAAMRLSEIQILDAFLFCCTYLEGSGNHWRSFECALEEWTVSQQTVCACGHSEHFAFHCGSAQKQPQMWLRNLLVCEWPQKEVLIRLHW